MSETKDVKETTAEGTNEPMKVTSNPVVVEAETPKKTIVQRIKDSFFTFGSATQIVSAAVLAIAIGLIVSTQVDNVPVAAIEIINIPGDLWLRALKAVGKYFWCSDCA